MTIASECEDPEAIKSELIDVRGDILFTSFMLPESEQQMGPAATDDGSATAIAMRQSRTDSLHENREPGTHRGSLPPLPTLTTPDLRLAGVPEPLVTAGFTYPSLGRLGNTLLQYSEVPSFKFHCIMHEATSTNRMARAMTMLPEGVRNRPLSQAVPYDSASSLVSIGHSESVLSGGEKVSTPEADDESGSDDFGIEYSDSVDVRAELNLSDKKVN